MGGYMYKKAIEVLNIFHQNGYLAYIVGGYPRDYLLGIKTKDIDICTNASPKEIMEIFDTEGVSDIKYGSVKVIYKKCIYIFNIHHAFDKWFSKYSLLNDGFIHCFFDLSLYIILGGKD